METIQTASTISFDSIKQLVKDDLARVNALILDCLKAEVPLAEQVSEYIIESGGKRLRPVLTLLSAKAFGYVGDDHIILAAIVELIHTATLLHDDVIDASLLRRGKPTANAVWDNQACVLVGDFLYSRAFELMTRIGQLPVLKLLATASNTISQGEILQLSLRHQPETTENQYFEIIKRKTAVLFSAAAELGALISQANIAQQQAMQAYGLHLGMAFQMIDDYLDYAVSSAETGKNLGDDLAEGKLTLPLIYAMQSADSEQKHLLQAAIKQGGLDDFAAILNILENSGVFPRVKDCAQNQADLAINALSGFDANPYIKAMQELCHLAIHRKN